MNREMVDGALLLKMLTAARHHLQSQQEIINSLNVFPVPDGDTGTNMSLTMEAALRETTQGNTTHAGQIMNLAANGSLMGARGNSGVILSQLFRGFAKSVQHKEVLNVQDLADAMKKASDTAYQAVMKPTEGTILTVARESAEKALTMAKASVAMDVFFLGVIEAANESLAKTPELLKVLKDAGVVDSGGKGLVSIFEGAYNGLTGKVAESKPVSSVEAFQHTSNESSLEFGYCTEFIIHASDSQVHSYREIIKEFGDSLLVVGNDQVIKVHIHTNHPGTVMEKALKLGPLSGIKIDNMRMQHRHEVFDGDEYINETTQHPPEKKPYGIIAVAMGDGITKIFKDFTVDVVIEGGQTMNPSTEDFLNAIGNINASHVFVLPNNSNIIMAANQAKAISEKPVTVIPTKTVPEGISAVLSFNSEMDVNENEAGMNEAISFVRTGMVTYAVRDTEINHLEIKKDEIIGLADKEILAAGENTGQVSFDLLAQMIRPEDEILTIYFGEEIKENEAQKLEQRVSKEYPELEVELYYGGQPLYYYLFSLE